jgi:hypothetical protein
LRNLVGREDISGHRFAGEPHNQQNGRWRERGEDTPAQQRSATQSERKHRQEGQREVKNDLDGQRPSRRNPR